MRKKFQLRRFASAWTSYALVLAMVTGSVSFPGYTVSAEELMKQEQEEVFAATSDGADIQAVVNAPYRCGMAGDDITWNYYTDGYLEILGSGEMYEDWSWDDLGDCIKTVKIASGIETISPKAFWKCTLLTNIEIPDTVTSIGEFAFYNCSGLENVELPDSITTIGDKAFINSGLVEIKLPANLEILGEYAFYECANLKKVSLDSKVTELPERVFSCTALEAIDIPGNITKIDMYAFSNTNITSLTIPATVKELGWGAFAGNEKLVTISMADSEIQLDRDVFSNCTNLKSVHLSEKLAEIPEEAFDGCTSLETIVIPNSVQTIGVWAFGACRGLKEITIPANVKEIKVEAFRGCSNIEYHVSKDNPIYNDGNDASVIILTAEKALLFGSAKSTIPSDITQIGNSAFAECNGIESVVVPEGVTSIGERAFWASTIKSIDLPDSLTFIGSEALSCCNNLEEVELPDNVSTIEFCLFSCNDNLKRVKLPKNCVYIDEYAFCSSLTEIEIPQSVRTIEERAFDGCTGLTKIINHSSASLNLKSVDEDAIWVNEKDGSTAIIYIKNGTALKVSELDAVLKIELEDGLNYIYTGEAIKPNVTVTCKGCDLVEGKDYTLKYANNVNVPAAKGKEPTVTVVGKGNYAGNYSATFHILPADIEEVTVANTSVVTGTKPALVLMYHGKKLTTKDYVCAELANKITKDTTFEIAGNGNFTGQISVDVKAVEKNALQKLSVTLDSSKFVYNGENQFATVKVVDSKSKTVLTENVDYVVSYPKNCTDVGAKSVTVTGIGLYTGSVAKKYSIEPTTTGVVDASELQSKKYNYNGAGVIVADDLVVKDSVSGAILKENVDYKISYSGNKKTGTAKCTVKFQGNYKKSPTVTTTYQIVNGILSNDSEGIGVFVMDLAYNGKPIACKTNVYVELNGVLLKSTDYTVSYYRDAAMTDEIVGKNNLISLGEGEERKDIYVKVRGKGMYANADESVYATGRFKVVSPYVGQANISKAKIVLVDDEGNALKSVAYSGTEVTPAVRVEYNDGKKVKIVDPSQYTVTYLNNVNKGKATILINGNGYHVIGGTATTFTIGSLSLKNLTASIKDFLQL